MSIEKPIIGIVSKYYPKYEKRRLDTVLYVNYYNPVLQVDI